MTSVRLSYIKALTAKKLLERKNQKETDSPRYDEIFFKGLKWLEDSDKDFEKTLDKIRA